MEDVHTIKAVAVLAARAAWAEFKDFYKKDKGFKIKQDETIVTEADMCSHRILVARLQSVFPKHGIVSEEAELSCHGDPTWYIDPLDGTQDFLDRTDEFAIHLGVVYDRKPVVAVVYAPALNKMYTSIRGEGAFVEDEQGMRRLHVGNRTLENAIVVLSRKDFVSEAAGKIKEQLGAKDAFQSGSFGVKIGHIVEGRADEYVNNSFKAGSWDVCAPQLILEEAGGKLTDFDGKVIEFVGQRYLPRGAVASNGVVHEALLARVQKYLSLK